VAPLHLAVQVRAPGSDAAMADPRGLTGQGERVQADRPVRRGLWGPRVPVGEGRIVVGLHHRDPERERRVERGQEGESCAVRQLREEPDHPESGAVIERRVLKHLASFHHVRDIFDVDLHTIAWPGHDVALLVLGATPVSGEQPRPLQDTVNPVHTRDAPEPRAEQVPAEPSGAIAGPSAPSSESPGHPRPHLPRMVVRAPGAIDQAQAIPRAAGVSPPPLVVGLPRDPEEDTGIGHRAELLGFAEPVQPLPNALFPDKVWHG